MGQGPSGEFAARWALGPSRPPRSIRFRVGRPQLAPWPLASGGSYSPGWTVPADRPSPLAGGPLELRRSGPRDPASPPPGREEEERGPGAIASLRGLPDHEW